MGSSGGSGSTGSTGSTSSTNTDNTATGVNTDIKLDDIDDQKMADYINEFLEEKGSPAAGTGAGEMMVQYGKEYDVDPLILLSIAGQETQWGSTGIGVNGMLGVGAYDSNPNNATTNSNFAGVENQIRVGAKTFHNLREKGGSSSSDSVADQTAAVNAAGWATDQNWHNGVTSIYNQVSAGYTEYMEEHKDDEVAATNDTEAASTSSASSAQKASSSSSDDENVNSMLSAMSDMVGLREDNASDAAQINKITGESGIDCSTTPWCAAYAMNMLQDYGVLDSESCSNINYCPTIKNWAQDQGLWENTGDYTPQSGDAILFDWVGDGESRAQHIGVVEKVEDGKVYTIEGNSSDQVKRKEYSLSDANILGYINCAAQ